MRRLAAVALVAVGCTAGGDTATAPKATTTTRDPIVDVLEERVAYLEAELVKSNVDQTALREEVKRLYTERASRSTRTARAVRRPGACSGWGHLVFRYPWPHSTACAVLACESGGNPNARNPRSSATGLFQILNGPLDPEANVALAFRMWQQRGWQPWNVGGCP